MGPIWLGRNFEPVTCYHLLLQVVHNPLNGTRTNTQLSADLQNAHALVAKLNDLLLDLFRHFRPSQRLTVGFGPPFE